ncbi:MAG: autotransporter domain-containing protein, partial [Burkholderiales bacterium]
KEGGTNVNIAVAVGGNGGGAGNGGIVSVTNTGNITTVGDQSPGIYAQSIGGGGGNGGNGAFGFGGVVPSAIADKIAEGLDVILELRELDQYRRTAKKDKLKGVAENYLTSWDVSVGGSQGASGSGGAVTVANTGNIRTLGDDSAGIFAQSVGGGGGVGGSADAGLLGKISVAGGAGSAGTGGDVSVTQVGDIETGAASEEGLVSGKRSHGIYAESVGGGGGMSGDVNRSAKSLGLNIGLGISFGRGGGNSGNGGAVTVDYTGNITTRGEGATGIFAQSVGGGGGDVGDLCNNPLNLPEGGCAGLGSGAGSAGDIGNNPLGIAGSGGGAGDGGKVTVTSRGTIRTYGFEAHGIFAQSVGGGGGKAGGFWGSVGGDGAAGDITVAHTGSIYTFGDGAHGVLAQSRAGTNGKSGGNVTVTLNGDVVAMGRNADGIRAQSAGGGELEVPVFDAFGVLTGHEVHTFDRHNGAITMNVGSGTVAGSGLAAGSTGFGGVGVRFIDGAMDGDANVTPNVLNNSGTITTLSGANGWAIVGGAGRETINNFGIVTGSIDLGAGSNTFNNKSGAILNAGPTLNLGSGNSLNNAGTLAPGGAGVVQRSTLTGNLVQTRSGSLSVELDTAHASADRVDASGTANLAGTVHASVFNPGYVMPGTHRFTILSSAGGVTNSGLGLVVPPSAVARYDLAYPNATDVQVGLTVDYVAPNLNGNQTAVGDYINAIQRAGGSDSFASIASALLAMPDAQSLAAAYDRLSPEAYLGTVTAMSASNHQFNNALHSCRVPDGEFRFVREDECWWMRASGRTLDRERSPQAIGFREDAFGVAGGMQRAIGADWHAGFGLSYEDSTLNVADGFGRSNGDRYQVGLIMKRGFGATTLSGSASLAHGRYHTTRIVDLPVPGTTAKGTQEITVASGQFRLAHDFERTDWYVRPMIDFAVSSARLGGFEESGAGGANLHVASSDYTYVSLRPAAEVGGELMLKDGTLVRPFFQLGVTHYVSGGNPQITATMEGAPAGVAPFNVTAETDKTFAELSVGVDLINREGHNLRLSTFGEYSRHTSGYGVSLKLSIPF